MNKESTMKPFAPGDILIGLTDLNDPDDDHAGDGRIVQYGADLRKKGELWTEGGHHLVGGFNFGPDGILWAFNETFVLHVDPKTGRQLPLSNKFKRRICRNVNFAPDGSIYLGENIFAKDPPPGIEKRTTVKFSRLPDTGWLGHGRIYKYDRNWNLLKEFDVDHCPEITGFKGVTHASIHPGGQFITYTAETGKRVMRFDIVNERQMPDLVKYPGDNIRDGVWAIAVRYLSDGRLLIVRSKTMDLVDERGNTLREYRLGDDVGWSDVAICRDRQHVLVINIWNGQLVKLNLDSGDIVGVIDTGFRAPRRSLAGVAEYAGH